MWALCARARQLHDYARGNWGYGLVGCVGTLVSALRETSILFGVLISAWVQRKWVTRRRWVAAGLIVAGAVVLRVA